MKSWFLAAALAAAAGPAYASWEDWSGTVVAENDVFDPSPTHTDRYYTHGTMFSAVSPEIDYERLPGWVKWTCFLEMQGESCGSGRDAKSKVAVRWGLAAGQNIYTPESLDPIPDPKDRPYAGWAYVGASFGSYSRGEANTLEVQLGVVGPSSGSAWAQNHVHDLIRAARFAGWDNQLKDEVAFVVMGERKWAPDVLWSAKRDDPSAWALDLTNHVGFALGTLQVSGSVGSTLRFGRGLDSDSGPPRIRPAPSGSAFIAPQEDWSLYAFAGGEGHAVVRDIFLDGNTFQSSPSVARRWWTWEGNAGAAYRWRGIRLAYTYVWRGEEFLGQHGPQKFGSWSVTVNPAGFLKAKRSAD